MGPTLPFSEEVHASKYRGKDESYKEAMTRIAGTLEDNEAHFRAFREVLLEMRFMPGGRIQRSIGSTSHTTAYNCFVSGAIEDSFVDGHGSIMAIAAEAAATMRMGGGIGYNFGSLRPRGDTIAKLASSSSGPVSFMEIYDAICRCVSSSGHRRGAQMGVFPIDHPDIEEFVHCKQPPKEAYPVMDKLAECVPGTPEWLSWYSVLQKLYKLTGFNISVAITDEFMQCLKSGKPFGLRFGGRVYREVDPNALWDLIMRSTWDWAEPGVIFIDTVQRMNNLYYCEKIIATNPCGEQPLPPYGACLLGSFNLVKYVVQRPGVSKPVFDFDQLGDDIPHVVRAMDNVIDKSTYPLYEQEKEAKSKRRMGLGITGLANALEALGLSYGSDAFVRLEGQILAFIANRCYQASVQLAQEKGVFPLYNQKYLSSQYVQTLDEETRELIKKYGIRNSHLISIAPCGTISMCADNVSSGIEPVFSYMQERIVNMPGGQLSTKFDDYGFRVFGVKGRRSAEVTIDEHLDVLAVATHHVDSAVSKTCNVPANMPWDDFRKVYVQAWEMGCKGLTTFQAEGKRMGIIKSVDEDSQQGASCRIDSSTGRRECE
jgi:ribonucleoside-diphosphate reductase alpha chain